MSFDSPDQEGKLQLKIFFMNDSYLGADQEFDFQVEVIGTN